MTNLTSRAAVLWGLHEPWKVQEIEVEPPMRDGTNIRGVIVFD